MKINNKNSNLHRDTGLGCQFAELRGFGVARPGSGRRRTPTESPDFAPVAAGGGGRTGAIRKREFEVSVAAVGTTLAAATLAGVAVALLLRLRGRLPVAERNARSLHTAPVPRVGGLAIWAGWIPVACLVPASPGMGIATWGVPWAMLFAVSLRDDMRGVAIAPRLAVHGIAACWFAWASAAFLPGSTLLSMALVALVAAWSLNLYNFMDGSDGLAAAMSVAGFAAMGAVLLWHRMPAEAPLALAAATIPVLLVNRPPARIFLGDVGAVPLGFLAAALGIGGVGAGAWGAWFPVLVFLPFIADASVTLATARAPRRAVLGGPQDALLPAPPPDGRRPRRHARRLRRADGGHRRHRGGLRMPETRVGRSRARRVVCSLCATVRGD